MVARSAPVQLLEHAARGEQLDASEWAVLVGAWLDGAATDAQMSTALARSSVAGLEVSAQLEMVEEIVSRGDRLDLAPLGASCTFVAGAVGDALDLIVPPLAAAIDVPACVVAVRGRDGVLGGADKLEGLFGMRLSMTAPEIARQVRDAGVAVVTPTGRFGEGSARIERLMEQTGLGLAAAVAGPALAARLLVSGAASAAVSLTHGAGGLLAGPAPADEVRALLEAVAADWGRSITVTIEDGSSPLGPAVGSSLEIAAAGVVISGGGDARLRERAVGYVASLAELAQVASDGEGRSLVEAAIDDGRALASAERWLEGQGAPASVWTDHSRLPEAPHRTELIASADGVLHGVDAGLVGEVARWIGAGRLHPSQHIDPVAGVELLVGEGVPVQAGEPLAVVHCRDGWQATEGVAMLEPAFAVVPVGGDDPAGA